MTLTSKQLLDASASERNIQDACIEYLMWRGWFVIDTSQIGYVIRGMVGFPDLVAFRDGVTILCELKRKGGRLRKSQEAFRERIAPHLSATLRYEVIRSIDYLMQIV